MTEKTIFADVGPRTHTVPGGYTWFHAEFDLPTVALCGSVFSPADPSQPGPEFPECLECTRRMREANLLRAADHVTAYEQGTAIMAAAGVLPDDE